MYTGTNLFRGDAVVCRTHLRRRLDLCVHVLSWTKHLPAEHLSRVALVRRRIDLRIHMHWLGEHVRLYLRTHVQWCNVPGALNVWRWDLSLIKHVRRPGDLRGDHDLSRVHHLLPANLRRDMDNLRRPSHLRGRADLPRIPHLQHDLSGMQLPPSGRSQRRWLH
jgi:hypothetical protein